MMGCGVCGDMNRHGLALPRPNPVLGLMLLALSSACGRRSPGVASPGDAGDAPGPGGAGGPGDAPGLGDASVGDAAPLKVPAGTWTWIDVPESACDEGSPTGFGVNPGTGDDLLVYFEGGGACWDYASCVVLNTSTHGPVGRAQWNARVPQIGVGPFDRVHATNAFRASTYVYIPYCTGDLHAGSNVQAYQAAGDTRMIHHVGRRNAVAALARIVATWPNAARVVVSGSSAGGFGATFNYDLFRRAFPSARMDLVDDAGPLLEGEGINASLRSAWFASWHLGDTVDALCPGCRTDLSGLTAVLASRYPQDRLALLSSLQDQVIAAYFMLSADQIQSDLLMTAHDRFDPTGNARVYLVAGNQHGFLPATATTVSKNVKLETWLDALVNGGAAWASVMP
jgi:Pectinacetylesterase